MNPYISCEPPIVSVSCLPKTVNKESREILWMPCRVFAPIYANSVQRRPRGAASLGKDGGMLRRFWMLPLVALIGTQIARAQSAEPTAALFARLLDEMRSLRVELAEVRLERQAGRMRLLQQEMDAARNMRARRDAEARSQEEELRRFRSQLETAEFNAAERALIESSKAEATAEAAERIRRERLAAEQSESAAYQDLAREKEEHRKLNETLALMRRAR